MKTTHQMKGKSMADNDCYGGQHFPRVVVDQISLRLGDQLQLSFGICWDQLQVFWDAQVFRWPG